MYQRPTYPTPAERQQPVAMTTPGMQNQFFQPLGATSHTPTIPPKFPPLDNSRNLTPQMPHRTQSDHISQPLSGLSISNSTNQTTLSANPFNPPRQPTQFGAPPTSNQPGQFGAPPTSNQPGQFGAPPTSNQPGQFGAPPTSNQPSQFGAPPTSNQPSQFGAPPTSNQPSQFGAPPTSNQPSQFGAPPTSNQPGQFGAPPTSNQPSQFGAPPTSNQPGQLGAPPTSNQPGQFGAPPTSNQPSQLGAPPTSNQPGQFGAPPTSNQPSQLGAPPTSNQPGQFGAPPTSNQPGQFGAPPTSNQPGQFGAPPTSNQPGQFGAPPTSNQPSQFGAPPTSNQPSQFGAPPTSNQPGQFGAPPTSNQPSQFGAPPTSNQPGQLGAPPTSNQPGQFGAPPTSNQPSQLGAPPTSNQPGQFGAPPTSNQPSQLGAPPTSNQPGQFGAPPTSNQPGQFGAPPTSNQPGQFGPPLPNQFPQLMGATPPVTTQPKVTPDTIPSVIEVLAIEKERWVSNEYLTGSRTPPPGTLISCPIKDTGNASPIYIRSSLYTMPTSADMIKESKLVTGLIIQPLANDPDNGKLPLVDHGATGPIRCKRCKAYMNPFNSFTGGGTNFVCIFCGISNEVPNSYFQYCDASGQRMDVADRSELSKGSYEQTVTKDYMRHQREGDPPALLLVIDISVRSYNVGLEGFLSSHISDLLERLPRDEDTGQCPLEIGLIVYDTQAYYFNLSTPLPLIYVITDSADPFLPEPAGSLVPVPQAINSIKGVLDRFPLFFPQRKNGGCLGVGVKAGLSMLSEMRRVGKLLVFQAEIPEIYGPGQLKRRTDNFFKPQTAFYDKLSADCQRAGVSVDLFLLPSAYTDVFTLGQLCHMTGGQLHYHYNFSASKPACYSRLLTDLQQSLSTQIGFDAVMRVRTSPGISADQYQGALRLSGSEVQLAGLDASKTVAVVLRYDDKLKEGSLVYVQVALLYTNFKGERRLRLHNLALCTSSHYEDVYLSADLDTLVHLLARLNLRGFIEEPMETVSDRLRQQVAHVLAVYRKHCNPASNMGQLILPSPLKLLPCYSNCILKLPVTPPPTPLPNSPDMRAHSFYRLQWLPTREFMLLLYPRVYPLDCPLSSLPDPVRASVTRIQEHKGYLATDGQQLVMWIGSNISNQLIAEVFGVSSVHQVDPSLSTLPKLDNSTSRQLHQSLTSLQSWVGKPLPLSVSKQGDQSEHVFRSMLVEDGIAGRVNYVDTMCLLHREIKRLLT